MTYVFKDFAADASGAVTVDWVVLTAAVVGLGLLAMAAIKPAVSGLSDNIAASLEGSHNTVPDSDG